ncbi:MAG: efflux RND transporter periplasmic adaptor subunit [Lentisphaeria bacterium]|nr:efflux RND transporter periplasmic adaptor subunit [Lentisphaeria bacterium]
MGKKITGVVLAVLVIGFGVFAGIRAYEHHQKQTMQEAAKPVKKVVVNIAMPTRKTMRDERRFSGSTKAWSDFKVEPKVSGKLLRLHFDIGDKIKRDALIAEIDDREFRQNVLEAEANLEYAKAKLLEAQGVAKLKRNEYERRKSLIELDAISLSDFEQAESEMNAQIATEKMCQADVKRYEALLAHAKLTLSYCKIYAKWGSGDDDVRYIGDRYLDEGTLLTVNTPILNIVELGKIKANVAIIERDFPFLRVGQVADIETDAYPGRVFHGSIAQIGNIMDDKTRSAKAVISIDNKDLSLRPGMFIRVRIILGERKNAQVVPLNAIVQKDDKSVVFQNVDGKAVMTEVNLGLQDHEFVEVISPELKYPVATIGNHLLNDGMPIQVSELSRMQMAEAKLAEENKKNAAKKKAGK